MKKVFMIIAMVLFTVGAMANTVKAAENTDNIVTVHDEFKMAGDIATATLVAENNATLFMTDRGSCTIYYEGTSYTYSWNGSSGSTTWCNSSGCETRPVSGYTAKSACGGNPQQ